MNIHDVFAANLRAFRKQKGMSQEELAELCGLHRTYIGGIEQCRVNPSIKNVAKIAQALEVEPALLLLSNHDESDLEIIRSIRSKCIEDETSFSFDKGDFALCEWTENGIVIKPIKVHDEELSLRLLSVLIEEGYTDDIVKAYDDRIDFVTEVFALSHDRAIRRMLKRMNAEKAKKEAERDGQE